VDLQPPPVTIVDPNAQTGTADVLSSGRDPWRPSRRQAQVIGVVVAVAAIAAGSAAVARHRQVEAAKDRAAVRGLILHPAIPGPQLTQTADGDAPPPIAVRNDGRLPVRLLGARLGPANPRVALDVTLIPAGITQFDLPDTRPCTPAIVTAPITEILLDVRTARGTQAQRSMRLADLVLQDLNRTARTRCGYQVPGEALMMFTYPSLLGRTVRVELSLSNASVLPLTLDGLAVPDGTRLLGFPGPVHLLPASAPGEQGKHVSLFVTIERTSCAQLLDALNNGAPRLVVSVHGPYEDDQVESDVVYPNADGSSLFNGLAQDCPNAFHG